MSKAYAPGAKPLKYRVIVLPDPIDKMSGPIEKAPEAVENEKRMQTRGTLIDFSDMAFDGWDCDRPKKLNRIEYAVYSGQVFEGDDGREYKIMNDEDVVAFWGDK